MDKPSNKYYRKMDVEARVRHLQHVRDRWRKYIKQMKDPSSKIYINTLYSEQLVLLKKWEKDLLR